MDEVTVSAGEAAGAPLHGSVITPIPSRCLERHHFNAIVTRLTLITFLGVARLATAHTVRIVDDRAAPIHEALEIRRVAVDSPPYRLASGDDLPTNLCGELEIEGDGFGPTRITIDCVSPTVQRTIVVPRKATISLPISTESKLTMVLVPQQEDQRTPWITREVSLPGEVRVPAGPYVAVVRLGARGVDAALLNLTPGSVSHIKPNPSQARVAIVKCVRKRDAAPVAGADVRESALDRDGKRIFRPLGRTNAHGLVVLRSEGETIPVLIEAKGLLSVETRVSMEKDAPAQFERVELSTGARPTFHVSVDGKERAGVQAILLPGIRNRRQGDEETPEGSVSGQTDEAGRWAPSPVPGGPWILRLTPEKNLPGYEQAVELEAEAAPLVEVSLSKIPVRGDILRGKRGLAGRRVLLDSLDSGRKFADERRLLRTQSVETDEAGHFETAVWSEGRFALHVPGFGMKTIYVPPSGTDVKFELAANDLVCVVRDSDGDPIPGSFVLVASQESGQRSNQEYKTDSAGQVRVSVTGGVNVTVSADARGYESSGPVTVHVPDEGLAEPISLRLKKSSRFVGRFTGSLGYPMAGATVLAFASDGQFIPTSETTDSEGRFEVYRGSDQKFFRLYLVSAGAPLTIEDVYDVGTSEHLVLAPAETGLLELQLKDRNQSPVVGRTVALEWHEALIDQAALYRHLSLRGYGVVSDGRGVSMIPDLPAGEYTVLLPEVASSDGRGPYRLKAAVGPGRTAIQVVLEDTPKNASAVAGSR